MQQKIDEFMEGLKLEEDVSAKMFEMTARRLIQARSIIFYLIWKKLKEMHPEVNATEVLKEASIEFGLIQSEGLKKRLEGKNIDAETCMLSHISKMQALAFDVELKSITPEKSIRYFKRCPHVEIFEELGVAPEDIKTLCRDMLCHGDYATFYPFDNIDFIWEHTIADDGERVCRNIIATK